jgi:hypothetical protein
MGEDNYTDILQSILKLRFPFYGWAIHDHPHFGTSGSGIGPGEPDLVIEYFSQLITIAEAFILCGKNKNVVHEHIEKCFRYTNSSERYYIIIYYKGKIDKFQKTWENYMDDFIAFKFPVDKKPLESKDVFVILNSEFDNMRNFQIAKTCHEDFEMFHIMVNFGSEEKHDTVNS